MIMEKDRTMKIHRSVRASGGTGMTFILSTEDVDRMNDVIRVAGWRLENFRRSPVALFNHNKDAPIGTWKDVRVESNALRGKLELAPEGIPRVDEIRKLISAGVLNSTSVGFRPIRSRRREDADGIEFLEQELLEVSIVSVPANPAALSVARSLNISEPTQKLVFAPAPMSAARTREISVIAKIDRQLADLKAKANGLKGELVQLIGRRQECEQAAREAFDLNAKRH
jgi:HK97 family phage prohead protease